MSRPTKFDLMRANRKAKPETEREALQRRIEFIEAEMSAEWRHEARELREVDMDAIHAKRQESKVPRWWHGLKFNRRTT